MEAASVVRIRTMMGQAASDDNSERMNAACSRGAGDLVLRRGSRSGMAAGLAAEWELRDVEDGGSSEGSSGL